MGWIRDLLTTNNTEPDALEQDSNERFPRDTYGPGYPIVLHRSELEDFFTLLETERDTPDGWEKSPLLDRDDLRKIANKGTVTEGGKLPSPEEQRAEIRRILELWESQLTASTDTVWATVGTSYTLEFYLTRCETRADIDGDEFEVIPEFEAVRAIIDRIETAEDTDSKLAIVHKRHLPLEEPAEE